MFGRKSRAEKLRQESPSLISGATLATALDGARPFAERLFSDDDLRDNIRSFLESARKILDELSDEDPTDIVARLWDDDKLRREVETAVEALQEGTKRIRGQRVRKRGGSGKILLVLVLGGVGFLFLNPRTGPQARRMAGDVLSSFRSGS
ncbi:MAG: hypothetical protein M3272_07080 [Actinomycetota bacterium]|nr:hypothetical protein [Actinomycetota bacterium]MDQ3926728.1 hypothetical protein [Actinomycetota bacterium]